MTGNSTPSRIFGIGLDGFPLSLARKFMTDGVMPNLSQLAASGRLREIESVVPTVSNVAWASFQTGKAPGEFGVYGFVELKPDLQLAIPDARSLGEETIWKRLSDAGQRVVSLSVPMTYPAPEVNGLLVSGFLAPQLDERAVSTPEVLEKLARTRYEIDVDPRVAHHSIEAFQRELTRVSAARQKTALALMESEPWDLFFLHVMDTDRINHFMWRSQHEPESAQGTFFRDFYAGIDRFLGEVAERLPGDAALFICSDHGFCDLGREVQLNRWLRSEGYLDYELDPGRMYRAIRPGSRAVSLVPGRIYLLTSDRWDIGAVHPEESESLRNELTIKLKELKDPQSGGTICRRVMNCEEAFGQSATGHAPDIVLDPVNGYDLKAQLGEGDIFETSPRTGMHTFDDALLLTDSRLGFLAESRNITEVGRNLSAIMINQAERQ